MAIVKMNKFTLLVFESHKKKILESLQNFEKVHFINLQDEGFLEKNKEFKNLKKDIADEGYASFEENISKLKFALEFLQPYKSKKPALKALKEGKKALSPNELSEFLKNSDWEEVYETLRVKEQNLNSLQNDLSKHKTEIENLEPWSSFDSSFESLKALKFTNYFIGRVSNKNEETLKEELASNVPDSYIEVLGNTNEDAYILIIALKSEGEKTGELIRQQGFSSFALNYDGIPVEIIDGLKISLDQIKNEIAETKESIKTYEDKIEMLEHCHEYYSNQLLRFDAAANFLKTDKIVAMSGWCAASETEQLEGLIKNTVDSDYVINFYEVSEDEIDEVPVKLKNNRVVEAFEAVTEMYSLPKYNEIDPTPLLAPFYFIFFGMMVADVGYGLVILLISSIALKTFNLDKAKKGFIKFFFYLSISTIIFGVAYGSYFGNAIKVPGLIDPAKDITTILVMSVVFGVIHIFFGLGIKAYVLMRDGHYLDALYDVGSWVITLVGAGLFGVGKMIGLSNSGVNIAKICMFVGMVLIVLTQGRHAKSAGVKIGSGLYALYGITGYIGDLVSYTRLMALGLAGGSIANALNLIMSYFPGITIFIIGPIFFVAVQTFNLLLSMLGAYVHTCRLQYVEYFSKFYEGGGKPFKAFKPANKYLELKKD